MMKKAHEAGIDIDCFKVRKLHSIAQRVAYKAMTRHEL